MQITRKFLEEQVATLTEQEEHGRGVMEEAQAAKRFAEYLIAKLDEPELSNDTMEPARE